MERGSYLTPLVRIGGAGTVGRSYEYPTHRSGAPVVGRSTRRSGRIGLREPKREMPTSSTLVKCLGGKWFERLRLSSSRKTPSSVRPRGFLFPRRCQTCLTARQTQSGERTLQIPRGNPQGAQSPQALTRAKLSFAHQNRSAILRTLTNRCAIRPHTRNLRFLGTWIRSLPLLLGGDGGASDPACFRRLSQTRIVPSHRVSL